VKAALFEERCMVINPVGAVGFFIWGAGRDGKAFYKALSPKGRHALLGWIDIDPGKIGGFYPVPGHSGPRGKRRLVGSEEGWEGRGKEGEDWMRPLPIFHFSDIHKQGASLKKDRRGGEGGAVLASGLGSMIVCVAQDAGGGELLKNIESMSQARIKVGGEPLIQGKNLFFMC